MPRGKKTKKKTILKECENKIEFLSESAPIKYPAYGGKLDDKFILIKVKKLIDVKNTDFTKPSIVRDLIHNRKVLGLTQEYVAKKMKTTTSAIGRFETGKGKQDHSPRLNTLEAYAKALGGEIYYNFSIDLLEKKERK